MNYARPHFCLMISAIAVLLLACTKAEFHPAVGVQKYPPTSNLSVYKTIPDREYVELGDIFVRGEDTKKMLERVKKEAMAVGAEAIILTPTGRQTQEMTSQRRTEFQSSKLIMRAIAIRFKQ